MARRCGCASDSCSCEIVGGEGVVVTGAGSPRNPYIVSSTVADIETGIDIQYNNVDVIRDVHQIDFRGSAITITPGTDEAVVTVTVPDPVSGYSVPVGAIWMFGAPTPPTGWLICDGTTKLIADYPNLFAVVGTRWGGDGTVNFKVPNMMDRMPVGASATKPLDGVPGGSETKAIGVGNLPPHTHGMSHDHGAANSSGAGSHDHAIRATNNTGTSGTVAKGTATSGSIKGPIEGDGFHSHSVAVPTFWGNTDGGAGAAGAALNIMPPWLALAFIIKA